MTFHLNSYLYITEDFLLDMNEEYQLNVELYDTDAKIEQISAYNFHPNRKTWWMLILDYITEFFYGRTVVLIRVEGQSSALYVRVDDVSRILNVSSQTILNATKENDATDFLIEHQIQQTAKKIKALVEQEGIVWTALEQNSLKELIEEFGYQNVYRVLVKEQFDEQRMALTLIEVGKQLAQYSVDSIFPKAYDFKVSFPNVSIYKMEDFKKTQIDLKDLVVTEEDCLKQTADKICNLAQQEGMQWTQIEQDTIEILIKKLGYQSVIDVINNSLFDAGLMACTLVEAGRRLRDFPPNDAEKQNIYEFEIDLPDLYIWKIENCQKIKVDVGNLLITFEDVSKPISPPASSKKKPALVRSRKQEKAPTVINKLSRTFISEFADAQELELKNFVTKLGFDSKDIEYLASLADRIGYSNLNLTLESLSDNEKSIMVNTFIEIGRQLSMPAFLDGILANFRLKYVGQQKEKGKRLTHAFAINKNDIFIVQDKLKEGTFKVVSNSIKLNDLEEPFVRIKIKEEKEDRCIQYPKHTRCAVREVRKEAKFIELLHKNNKESGSNCIVLPFACELTSDKGKNNVIFFQKKYEDGEKLQKAPLFQIIHVLRDVAKGLALIHKLGFAHMDVKLGNILIEGDIDGIIPVKGKLTDFGLTREIGQPISGGSFLYLAPEALSRSRNNRLQFDTSCDVDDKLDSFAFGVTILEVLQKFPRKILGSLNQIQINHEIEQYQQQIRSSDYKKDISLRLALINLAQQLTQSDPYQRLSCTEAISQLEEIVRKSSFRSSVS